MNTRSASATVLIPTTGSRGLLLPYSVGSVLGQTVNDLEVFVVGDGVTDETRSVVRDLQTEDGRVVFFDYPKGEGRGETYRHQALIGHAKGEIVCYLCDRDIMLPDHVETMLRHLQDYDFAACWGIDFLRNGKTRLPPRHFGADLAARFRETNHVGFGLSFVGHRMDFYRTLPHGWRPTPPGNSPSDGYMWRQCLAHAGCRAVSTSNITILYFKRGRHPGWPAGRRAQELEQYYELLRDPEAISRLKEKTLENIANDSIAMARRNRRMREAAMLIKGRTPGEWGRALISRFRRR